MDYSSYAAGESVWFTPGALADQPLRQAFNGRLRTGTDRENPTV
jgi:hypothetical protein